VSRVSRLRLPLVHPRRAVHVLFLCLFLPPLVFAQTPPEPVQELTFAEFRALLSARAEQFPEGARIKESSFFRLLRTQAHVSAARQSLDRLAGWTKAAQARLDAESAPLLDVEMLRFAEAKAEARLEQAEALRLHYAEEVNSLIGRELRSPLLAAGAEDSPSDASDIQSESKLLAARVASLAQLLPQAQDLLAKVYQNYLFGGVALTALLWQEEQVYESEQQYRMAWAEAEEFRSRLRSHPDNPPATQ
jgi:outer membrane protein TolC